MDYQKMLQSAISEGKKTLKQISKDIEGLFGPGKSSSFNGQYNPKQLKMGIEVEREHTSDPRIAERIAKDHLAEIPDYYTRLAKMEKEAGVEHHD